MRQTRSKLLVHWTGKDIGLTHPLSEPQRQSYVARLESILGSGFWMNKPEFAESLLGYDLTTYGLQPAMTCFTEIRLSQARQHAHQYGLLGVGVERDFVLDRTGGPVHYVRNRPNECIVGSYSQLFKYLNNHRAETKEGENPVGVLFMLMSFLKPMSELTNEEDHQFLDEQEWRIVQNDRIKKDHIARQPGDRPVALLPITHHEVSVIIFPDRDTVNRAIVSDFFKDWLSERVIPPTITCLEDVESF